MLQICYISNATPFFFVFKDFAVPQIVHQGKQQTSFAGITIFRESKQNFSSNYKIQDIQFAVVRKITVYYGV